MLRAFVQSRIIIAHSKLKNTFATKSVKSERNARHQGGGAGSAHRGGIVSLPLVPAKAGNPFYLVIPGRAKGAGPESITPVCDYGFRARRFAAPRNDELIIRIRYYAARRFLGARFRSAG